MDGLDLANRLFGATTREALLAEVRRPAGGAARGQRVATRGAGRARGRRPRARRSPAPCRCRPRPTSTCTCCATCRSPTSIPYLNLQMLLGKHLGPQGRGGAAARGGRRQGGGAARHGGRRSSARRPPRAWLRADGLYRFYEASAVGDAPRAPRGRPRGGALPLPAPARGRAALPGRLRAARGERRARLRGPLRGDVRRGRSPSRRGVEGGGPVSPLPRAPGARHRERRGLRRDAARAAPHPVGLPRSARAPPWRTGSRRAIAACASRRATRPARTSADQRIIFDLLGPRAHRAHPHRGLHDGSRGRRYRPSSSIIPRRSTSRPTARPPPTDAAGGGLGPQPPIPRPLRRRAPRRQARCSTWAAAGDASRSPSRPRCRWVVGLDREPLAHRRGARARRRARGSPMPSSTWPTWRPTSTIPGAPTS